MVRLSRYRIVTALSTITLLIAGLLSVKNITVSALLVKDDPGIRGELVNTLAPQVCGRYSRECQEEFKAAAYSCMGSDQYATGMGIANCIVDNVQSMDISGELHRIIQGIELAEGQASEVKNKDPATTGCRATILGFPAWYNGLRCEKVGDQDRPAITKINDIWVIVLNIIRWLLGVAAYAAAVFIIWGGFKYITSQGDPGSVAAAKTTLVQAIGGLIIALISVALVHYVQSFIIFN